MAKCANCHHSKGSKWHATHCDGIPGDVFRRLHRLARKAKASAGGGNRPATRRNRPAADVLHGWSGGDRIQIDGSFYDHEAQQ